MVGSGAAWNATVGRQMLPWLAITGDAGVLCVDEEHHSVIEISVTSDDATHATLMTGVRLEQPVHFGLTPSLQIETGLGWLLWGDRHIGSFFGDEPRTLTGERDAVWSWSVTFQIRIATRRRMLTPGVTARMVVFNEQGYPVRMTMLGVALRY